MEREERAMLEGALRRAVAAGGGGALDQALSDMGWADALVADAEAAVSLLFRLQGEGNATSSALHLVLAAGAGLEPGRGAPVLLPALGSSTPPGRREAGGLTVTGVSLLDGAALTRSDRLIVAVAARPDGHADGRPAAAGLVTVAAADLVVERVSGLDPDLGLHRVTAHAVAFEPLVSDRTGSWAEAVSLAQRAVGHELAGAARSMVELARTHALERVQFGQPIARFQAVRHRLADALVAVEGADALLAAAWEAPAGERPEERLEERSERSEELSERSEELSEAARAVAGRAARTAARHAQQVLAGIGFTAEHPFHRYLRRVVVLDRFFGTSRSLTAGLGTRVLAAGRVPRLLPL